MEILEEQLQSLQHEQPTKQEDDKPEPTIISRRQAELEAANDRLQHTAQNFTLEWKLFLRYAMKIKQQRATGSSTSPIAGEKDLEDILLKTQGGLVLLRELHNRRDHQWKEVAKRYGYQRQSIVDSEVGEDNNGRQQQMAKQPQWFQTLVSKLSTLNQQVAATAHCAVKRSQLTANQTQTQGLPVHQPSLLKQRAHALETHHRIQHSLDSSSEKETSSVITDCVRVEDVNMLMQFDHMKHQQAVVLERFCIRLKWMPVSHRYHLRQRMLALVHQQKVKNTSRPNASTAYRNSKDHLHCPLFMMSTPHFAAELKVLAQMYALPIPDQVDVRGNKSTAEEYHTLRQGADGVLASVVGNFPSDNAINTDVNVEMHLETVVHTYTRSSRWEMIQRGFLGNCKPDQGRIEETLISLRNDHKIDSLLANEWELLSLDDVEYLRVRLETLSRAHMNRAKVDVAVIGDVLDNQHQKHTSNEVVDDDDSGNEDDLQKFALSNSWSPDALHSLYVLRVASCRAKRLSLLRLLNYLHFVQLSQVNSLPNTSSRGRSLKDSPQHILIPPVSLNSTGGTVINPWIATKCEKTGDYIITRSPNRKIDDSNDENSNKSGDREFIFAAARRDLEVLELQMLRMASIFIFKQEYDSLPTSPRKHSNDRYSSDHDSDSIVTTIDRLQVLRDIYDCEVAFQQTKVQLVEKLLENGLQFAPRSQDLIELGFTTPETEVEPFTDILLPLLQRRPYLDFSHAYFFESYATETILLERQNSLIQQMQQHFERLEWCDLQYIAFGEQDDNDNEHRRWVCRQILGSCALIQLYSHQNELVREADEKWFSSTSVVEFHALQHALLEQTLVIWSLIIKLELPGRPVRCLERTAGDLLVGSGWQLVFDPQLLSDVCQTLHEQTSTPRALVEYLAKAVDLENWRHTLAKCVYEAHLLERIHQFHFGFVKHLATLDTVLGGEQARHLVFFFDFGECDRDKFFQPFAIELEMAMLHAANAGSGSKSTSLRSDDNKPISEWLHAQLSFTGGCGESAKATQSKNSENWRRSLLQLQQQYVSYLRVSVSYQDTVGADVFEFAASYPYVSLDNSLAPESSNLSDEKTTLSMDFNTVRTKYAKEISDKMTDEMRTSCFPYWKRLENLKQQLQERFATAQNQTSDTIQPGFQLQDMVARDEFFDEEIYHPRLLTTLNGHLQRLRNEKKLMQHLSPATRSRCAFIPHSTASDRSEIENGDQPSSLTKWLMVKLRQLKLDLHIHERPKVEQLLLTPPASSSSSSAFGQRTTRTFGTNRSPLDISTSDMQTLLQTIPSFRSLLLTFATTANYERPSRDTSGASSAHATRLHEYREETLRILVLIFHQFNCTIDLLRIRCGSRFGTTRPNVLSGQQHHLPTLKNPVSDRGTAHSGLGRLERWQTLFHREIRQLLDHLTNTLSPEAAVATGALFDTHPEHLQSQHYATLMRQEICSALQEANVHSIHMIQCASTFALLQTYQKNVGLRARKRRQHLISFQSVLENVTTEVVKPVNTLEDDGVSFTARMRRLVRAGEQALFGEARSHEREREWQAFKDAIGKYEPRDSAYITAVTRLLGLQRVFIDENSRAFLRLAEEANFPSLALQCAAENQALTAMEDLWERFHLPAWDCEDVTVKSCRVIAPIVGGENLDMKKRLLGPPDLGIPPSGTQSYSTPKDLSYALRGLQMGATTALTQFCNSGLLVLPHPSSIDEQLAYLHISVELTWVNVDMKELEDQYKTFLLCRKTHRGYHQTVNFTPRKSPRSQPSSVPTSFSMLLALSKYFHEERIPDDQIRQPDSSSCVDGEAPQQKPNKQGSAAAFIVPAPEMARILHDMTAQCVEHNKQQIDLHSASIQQLHDQFQAAVLEHEKVENEWTKAKVEERIRREAFAADRTYHLYFEVEALRKQLSVLEARKELDYQVMRCDINAEYDEKLRAMHTELLNKQQKFAEYRTTMQRELQSVIQGAHTQFVDQLMDYTGTLPSTTKASVSHLLRGQQDIVRIKSENAAMKQALLKVQALGDMQQQTQNSARERELLLTQRFATAQAVQRNEVEQLQAYIKQLEGNVSKLSEEKTYFQVKWTTAQKQMEATAQRKREAKIRALSASHTRTTLKSDSDDDDLPAFSPNTRTSPVVSPSPRPKLDDPRDTERVTDISTARPKTALSTIVDAGKQERQRLETQYLNSTRHYQNEIRRLQQQVTREIREKAAITEQLTQLRQYESNASTQLRDGLPFVDDLQTPRTPLGEQTLRGDFQLPSTPRRTQSASPRASLRSDTLAAAPSPPDRLTILKRPSSSFSPRASSLRAQVNVGSGTQPPTLVACTKVPVPSATSKPSAATNTSARKFQVVKRDDVVGGVAGVSNTLSVREPLPYR